MKLMTVIVFFLFLWNVLFKLFVPMGPLPEPFRFVPQIIRSPIFLVPYDAGLFAIIYLVVASKTKPEHTYLRALCYGMALAALLGEYIVLFVPWRA